MLASINMASYRNYKWLYRSPGPAIITLGPVIHEQTTIVLHRACFDQDSTPGNPTNVFHYQIISLESYVSTIPTMCG